MAGQEDLDKARQLRDDGKDAMNRGNEDEAKKKFEQALNLYNDCLQPQVGTSYPTIPPGVFAEKQEVEKILSMM